MIVNQKDAVGRKIWADAMAKIRLADEIIPRANWGNVAKEILSGWLQSRGIDPDMTVRLDFCATGVGSEYQGDYMPLCQALAIDAARELAKD